MNLKRHFVFLFTLILTLNIKATYFVFDLSPDQYSSLASRLQILYRIYEVDRDFLIKIKMTLRSQNKNDDLLNFFSLSPDEINQTWAKINHGPIIVDRKSKLDTITNFTTRFLWKEESQLSPHIQMSLIEMFLQDYFNVRNDEVLKEIFPPDSEKIKLVMKLKSALSSSQDLSFQDVDSMFKEFDRVVFPDREVVGTPFFKMKQIYLMRVFLPLYLKSSNRNSDNNQFILENLVSVITYSMKYSYDMINHYAQRSFVSWVSLLFTNNSDMIQYQKTALLALAKNDQAYFQNTFLRLHVPLFLDLFFYGDYSHLDLQKLLTKSFIQFLDKITIVHREYVLHHRGLTLLVARLLDLARDTKDVHLKDFLVRKLFKVYVNLDGSLEDFFNLTAVKPMTVKKNEMLDEVVRSMIVNNDLRELEVEYFQQQKMHKYIAMSLASRSKSVRERVFQILQSTPSEFTKFREEIILGSNHLAQDQKDLINNLFPKKLPGIDDSHQLPNSCPDELNALLHRMKSGGI